MKRSPRDVATTAVIVLLLAPGAAFAQSDGVTFDDGPSSKEYAIPLDAARGATKTKAPKQQAPAPATTTPATPPATSSAPAPAKKKKKKKSSTTTSTTTQAVAPAVTTPDPPSAATAPTSTPASSSSGTGAGIVIGGLALAVIALGGLAGLVLRRRRGPIDEF